jgi:hypothetical protein
VGDVLEMSVDASADSVKEPGQGKNEIICFRCNEKGHITAECRLRGQQNRQNLFMDRSDMVSPAL